MSNSGSDKRTLVDTDNSSSKSEFDGSDSDRVNESDESDSFQSTLKSMMVSSTIAESQRRKKMAIERLKKERIERQLRIADRTAKERHLELQSEIQISQDEAIGIDLKSLKLKDVEDELENRPKNGAIYDEVLGIWTTVNERLKFLSLNDGELSIDEAIEIYDASVLLKLLRKHEHEIESAGQIAHSGVLLILQAQMLEKKGRQQLALSKSKLQKADL